MYEWVLHIGRTHDAPATLDDLMKFVDSRPALAAARSAIADYREQYGVH